MRIDEVIGECEALADAYIEAMRGQGRAQAEGLTTSPEHATAKAAFDRLLHKTNVLEDHGRLDLAASFRVGSLNAGSAASIEAQRAALTPKGVNP